MKQSELMNILDDVATGKVTKEEALLAIKEEPFKDMGFAKGRRSLYSLAAT